MLDSCGASPIRPRSPCCPRRPAPSSRRIEPVRRRASASGSATSSWRRARQAREVKFVAVDFTREDLGERLAAAGHDRSQRTTWIWEGVVMYLTPSEVEATLRVVAARSAKGSRLVVVYLGPGSWTLPLVA